MAVSRSLFTTFRKNWYATEAIPLWAIIVTAVTGASWFMFHAAKAPEVTWNKTKNPYPWLNVDKDENPKLKSYSTNSEATPKKAYTRKMW